MICIAAMHYTVRTPAVVGQEAFVNIFPEPHLAHRAVRVLRGLLEGLGAGEGHLRE